MKKSLPPDPEDQNDARAEWTGAALAAFQSQTGTEDDDALSDLLCDLMHWADRHNEDFNAELARARNHYDVETTPEDPPLLQAAKLVLERWSQGDLAEAVRQLDAAVEAATSSERRPS